MTWSESIIITLAILCAFLGYLLIKERSRKDGQIVINKSDPMKDTYRLELDIPFGELDKRESVVFRISHE